jgi:response regulator RpfG family c-di-GMP phosphodiesterase
MNTPFRMCLLIDDSHLDNIINSKIIKMDNFASEVTIIEAPDKALALLRDRKILPDVIFLDIRMPQMSGFDFLNEYGQLDIDKSHTQIFMLSSSVDPADINRANKNQFVTKFITKPLSQDKLLALGS